MTQAATNPHFQPLEPRLLLSTVDLAQAGAWHHGGNAQQTARQTSLTVPVAPTAVNLDATAVVSGTELEQVNSQYIWTIDADPDVGTDYTEVVRGITAGYLFDEPGTYLIDLEVVDETGISHSDGDPEVTILVEDDIAAAAGTTYYVSPTGDDNNSGTSQGQPLATLREALEQASTISDEVRILLSGSTESNTSTYHEVSDLTNGLLSIDHDTDYTVYIGSDGTGTPILTQASSVSVNYSGVLHFSGASNVVVEDLHIKGRGGVGTSGESIPAGQQGEGNGVTDGINFDASRNMLFLNNTITNTSRAAFDSDNGSNHGVGIFNNTAIDDVTQLGVLVSTATSNPTSDIMIVGNNFLLGDDNIKSEPSIRIQGANGNAPDMQRTYVAGNTVITDFDTTKVSEAITIRGNNRYAVVSGNETNHRITSKPAHRGADQHPHAVVIEGNYVRQDATTDDNTAFRIKNAANVVLRNNVAVGLPIEIDSETYGGSGTEQSFLPTDNIAVYHNTYVADTAGVNYLNNNSAPVSEIDARNNLITKSYSGGASASTLLGSFSGNGNYATDTPGFISNSPDELEDYAIFSTSNPAGKGDAVVYVPADYDAIGNTRASDPPDAGAFTVTDITPPNGNNHLWTLNEPTGSATYADTQSGADGTKQSSGGSGIVSISDAPVGNAISLNDSNDEYIKVDNLETSTGDFSMAFWARSDGTTWNESNAFFSKQDMITFGGNSANPDAVRFYIQDYDDGDLDNWVSVGGDVSSAIKGGIDEWNHYAGTYDTSDGELKLYVNGVLFDNQTTPATNAKNLTANHEDAEARIGGSNNANSSNVNIPRYFDGDMDEVHIYDSVITLTDINALIEKFIFAGDYNNSGQVEQGDLDLVLQNWGANIAQDGIPAGWVQDLPAGQIEQTELDGVLQNWGNAPAAPEFGVVYEEDAFADGIVGTSFTADAPNSPDLNWSGGPPSSWYSGYFEYDEVAETYTLQQASVTTEAGGNEYLALAENGDRTFLVLEKAEAWSTLDISLDYAIADENVANSSTLRLWGLEQGDTVNYAVESTAPLASLGNIDATELAELSLTEQTGWTNATLNAVAVGGDYGALVLEIETDATATGGLLGIDNIEIESLIESDFEDGPTSFVDMPNTWVAGAADSPIGQWLGRKDFGGTFTNQESNIVDQGTNMAVQAGYGNTPGAFYVVAAPASGSTISLNLDYMDHPAGTAGNPMVDVYAMDNGDTVSKFFDDWTSQGVVKSHTFNSSTSSLQAYSTTFNVSGTYDYLVLRLRSGVFDNIDMTVS